MDCLRLIIRNHHFIVIHAYHHQIDVIRSGISAQVESDSYVPSYLFADRNMHPSPTVDLPAQTISKSSCP